MVIAPAWIWADPTASSASAELVTAPAASMLLVTPPLAMRSVPVLVMVPPASPAPARTDVTPCSSMPSARPAGTPSRPDQGAVAECSASGVARMRCRGNRTV